MLSNTPKLSARGSFQSQSSQNLKFSSPSSRPEDAEQLEDHDWLAGQNCLAVPGMP